jgi:Rieske Fe-S protein
MSSQRKAGTPETPVDAASHHDVARRDLLKCGCAALALLPVAGAAADPRSSRPQPNDLLVYMEGPRKGEVIAVSDLAVGDAPRFAYPMDPATKTVRDGSRLNQILLVRLKPEHLSQKSASESADGVIGMSAVCTHYGCQVTVLHESGRSVVCNCHGSTFDAGNQGEVLGGPAERRLAVLPLKAVDGALAVAAGFKGRLGPPQQ